tara:strand:- start:242 stop:415 length:174 start_codon:yes stop_codon:yes gene_type:complete
VDLDDLELSLEESSRSEVSAAKHGPANTNADNARAKSPGLTETEKVELAFLSIYPSP